MNTMSYKGYAARIEYDDEDKIFVGHIAGINDVVGFHGESVKTLEKAFHEAVNNYLDACKKLGQEPNKPASGRLLLRIPQDLHAKAAMMAEASGKSLNAWTSDLIAEHT